MIQIQHTHLAAAEREFRYRGKMWRALVCCGLLLACTGAGAGDMAEVRVTVEDAGEEGDWCSTLHTLQVTFYIYSLK